MAERVYQSSSLKKKRRTKAQMQAFEDALYEIVEEIRPCSVRQVFYQAVVRDVIEKTERGYQSVVRMLTNMRLEANRLGKDSGDAFDTMMELAGLKKPFPFDWIADATRWQRKPQSDADLSSMLDRMQEFYRRDLWVAQDAYVEIWIEKEALAGVVLGVTAKWDVPLMVTRGYPSISYLASGAETICAIDKPAYIYYFGDHDPSGVDISRNVEERLTDMTEALGFYDLTFERVAVTEDQIIDMELPTRPTKKTDSRSKNFDGESVELDAIPPDDLRAMVENCITRHVDNDKLSRTYDIEEVEQQTLADVIEKMKSA